MSEFKWPKTGEGDVESIDVGTTLTVGIGESYETIDEAMAFLSNKFIEDGITVDLQLKDETYTLSSSPNISHPHGKQIRLLGATTVSDTIASIDSVDSTAWAASKYHDVTVTVGSGASFDNTMYAHITAIGTGTNPEMLIGCHAIQSVASNQLVLRIYSARSTISTGAVSVSVIGIKTILDGTGAGDNVLVLSGYSLKIMRDFVVLPPSNKDGVRIVDRANCEIDTVGITGGGRRGFRIANGANADLNRLAVSNNSRQGFFIFGNATVTANNLAANFCDSGSGGYAAYDVTDVFCDLGVFSAVGCNDIGIYIAGAYVSTQTAYSAYNGSHGIFIEDTSTVDLGSFISHDNTGDGLHVLTNCLINAVSSISGGNTGDGYNVTVNSDVTAVGQGVGSFGANGGSLNNITTDLINADNSLIIITASATRGFNTNTIVNGWLRIANDSMLRWRDNAGTGVVDVLKVDTSDNAVFQLFPFTPPADPSSDYHVANKKYIDYLMFVMKEPTGFVDITKSTISFSDSGPDRTFTITPAVSKFYYYIKGTKYEKTGADTVQIGATEGLHYIYYDGSTLTSTTTFAESLYTDNALVSIVYWDLTNTVHIYFADERHGTVMSGDTHFWLHAFQGTKYESGLALTLADTVDSSGADDDHAEILVANGEIEDEDLHHNIVDGSPQDLDPIAQIPVYYKDGAAGNWRKTAAGNFPVKIFSGGSSLLAWNELTGGVWQQTEIANNQFVLAHIFASNDSENPIIAIQGQADYNSVILARAAAEIEIETIVLAGLPFAEFTALGTLIFQTSTTYANTPQARVRSTNTGGDYVDWRQASLSPGGTPSSHSSLTNLTSDDHLQYSRVDGTRAYTAKVSYSSHPTFTTDEEIVDKKYVDDAVIATLPPLLDGKMWIGNVSDVATAVTMSGDIVISNSGVTSFNGSPIVNADINAAAAIDFSKLAALASKNILVGSAGNVATSVAMSGDIIIDNAGVTTIQPTSVTNAMLNGGILFSKMTALTIQRALEVNGSGEIIVSAVTSTELGYLTGVSSAIQTQLNAKLTNVLTSANIFVGNVSNVATGVAMSGVLSITNGGVTAFSGSPIVNADINAAAAIVDTKLAQLTTGNKVAGSAVQLASGGGLEDNTGLKLINNLTSAKGISYVILDNDNIRTVIATANAITITLPTPSANTNRIITIKKLLGTPATGVVTIARDGGEDIDGNATDYVLDFQGEFITVQSDGTDWNIIAKEIPNSQYALTVTGTGFTSSVAEGYVHKVRDSTTGAFKWRVSFTGNGTHAGTTNITLTIANVTFKSGQHQAGTGHRVGTGDDWSSVFCFQNTSTFSFRCGSNATILYFAGDMWLNAKPSFVL